MTLPAITLPKVELPFDIAVLLHPPFVHFMIALPVVILLLELVNLIMKKKAIGGVSFFLIFLTVFIAAGAYLTGLTDGKEAYSGLGEAAKTALSEHKLIGTYLLLASVLLFFFKFISALTKSGIIKLFYMLVLIAFVAGIFIQGEEGGELVYKHGINVENVKSTVKTAEDEFFDSDDDETEEATPKVEKVESVATPAVVKTEEVKATPEVQTAPEVKEASEVKTTPEAEATPEVKTVPEVKTTPEVPAAENVEENTTAPVETLRTEIKEESAPEVVSTTVKETVKTPQVEGMPEEMVQPQIATH